MQEMAGVRTSARVSPVVPGRVAIWNRRLMLTAIMFILWGASMLALQASGPDVRAMIASEGMLLTGP